MWLRNTALNQAVIILFFAACLLVPRLLGLALPWVAEHDENFLMLCYSSFPASGRNWRADYSAKELDEFAALAKELYMPSAPRPATAKTSLEKPSLPINVA